MYAAYWLYNDKENSILTVIVMLMITLMMMMMMMMNDCNNKQQQGQYSLLAVCSDTYHIQHSLCDAIFLQIL